MDGEVKDLRTINSMTKAQLRKEASRLSIENLGLKTQLERAQSDFAHSIEAFTTAINAAMHKRDSDTWIVLAVLAWIFFSQIKQRMRSNPRVSSDKDFNKWFDNYLDGFLNRMGFDQVTCIGVKREMGVFSQALKMQSEGRTEKEIEDFLTDPNAWGCDS